jgi:hypothetical protein
MIKQVLLYRSSKYLDIEMLWRQRIWNILKIFLAKKKKIKIKILFYFFFQRKILNIVPKFF